MGVEWIWGWELGGAPQTYVDTSWDLGVAGFDTNVVRLAETVDTFQPAGGFGGGRFCLWMGNASPGRRIITPTTGANSIGTHSRFIFAFSYKRKSTTSHPTWDLNAIVTFYSGTQPILVLKHTLTFATDSGVSLDVWDGVSAYTNEDNSTTTFLSTSPYIRFVVDADGVAGTYKVYANGGLILEAGPAAQTFTSIDRVSFVPVPGFPTASGCNFDHCVLFAGGVNGTDTLTLTGNPADTETVTINGKVYTFLDSLTGADGDVQRAGGTAASLQNLIHAINLGPNPSSVSYDPAMTLNADVTAFPEAGTLMKIKAKIVGAQGGKTTSTTVTGASWANGDLGNGDSGTVDSTASQPDLDLALGDIFIQSMQIDGDSALGSWVRSDTGLQTPDLYTTINDLPPNLTDFIETTTLGDIVEFAHEDRTDIDPGWLPAAIYAAQILQITRASGTITDGRGTITQPSIGEITGDAVAIAASGIIQNTLVEWDGNATTDVDGLLTGYRVND